MLTRADAGGAEEAGVSDKMRGLGQHIMAHLQLRQHGLTLLAVIARVDTQDEKWPALAGYGAVTMANALKNNVTDMPALLWQSLTWDRGKELSDHVRFTVESRVNVFFADPHSPWQRGTNEKTNGFLRHTSQKAQTYLGEARKIQTVSVPFHDEAPPCHYMGRCLQTRVNSSAQL
jgi:IS30 family transposase